MRVRVEDPETGKPMAGIPVELQFELSECDRDADEIENKRNVVTGPDGYAIEPFQIPMATTCGEGDVDATATRGADSLSAG